MSGFAALMALSVTQTRATQSAVESAIVQRKRNEEAKRKQQEEREHKERELEHKLRLKHFEDEKREQEHRRRLEREAQERELVLQRREELQREALRYGSKKPKSASTGDAAPKWPTSNASAHSREEVRKRWVPSDDDDDSTGASALTREEKRERRLQADLKRTFLPAKRSSHAGGYSKAGKRLPGGAFDTTASPAPADAGFANQSVKARIAAIPNTLTKLNVVKRDTRTIDEILQDRAKARDVKVLDGDEAREFNDWFGKAKKKEPAKKAVPQPVSTPTSRSNTPTSQPRSLKSNDVLGVVPLNKTTTVPKQVMNGGNRQPASSSKNSSALTKPSSSTTKASLSNGSTSASAIRSKVSSVSTSSSTLNGRPTKKRTRSLSFSESSPPPSAKRRAASPIPSRSALSTEIWKMFGKDRTSYMQRDVYSDDEDMEVNATLLEKEEMRSYRIAQKEDQAALAEERRHEEEKRRRKKEKEKERRA